MQLALKLRGLLVSSVSEICARASAVASQVVCQHPVWNVTVADAPGARPSIGNDPTSETLTVKGPAAPAPWFLTVKKYWSVAFQSIALITRSGFGAGGGGGSMTGGLGGVGAGSRTCVGRTGAMGRRGAGFGVSVSIV